MSYNFTKMEKGSAGKNSYRGASLTKNGIYVSKSLKEEKNLEQYRTATLHTDVTNNAFMLDFRHDKEGWATSANNSSGLAINIGPEVNLPKGRYELASENGNQFIFKLNPDL